MILGECPLNPVQLLWLNLIMDAGAAIALSTEPPIRSVTKGPSIVATNPVMTSAVWRQVIGMSLYITTIMIIKIVTVVMNPKYKAYVPTGFKDEAGVGEFKAFEQTNIFHMFIFLQLFNQINCRKIGAKDFNVF